MTKVSDRTKHTSLNSEPCLARPTLIGLNSNKLQYYLFMVSLDVCNGSCNTYDDLSNRICIPNKIQNVNLTVFNMVTRINE